MERGAVMSKNGGAQSQETKRLIEPCSGCIACPQPLSRNIWCRPTGISEDVPGVSPSGGTIG